MPLRKSKTADAKLALEIERIAKLPVRERVLLALQLADDLEDLEHRANKPKPRS